MFDSLLIANRGEIACRIALTARRIGLRVIAVYSDADADALHVAMADAAVRIGPAPARESYLHIAAIIEAARQTGAEAIHPGYGFLSENADFAAACAQAGLVFVGPPASAIRAMGSKAAAKALMQSAGVPVVPGYHGEAQEEAILTREAERIGFPVLIKASAGGGGKGMRIVQHAADLPASIEGAQREATASFGDARLLIEKYLSRPRHIEIQVFADTHGHTVSLFERDCSIQRRHQKVLEESPAPGITPERRLAMGESAIAAARAVGYVGAGTVEFIAEGENFYFMEMNTRLQVEHPVTEMVTGLDLVEWQLRVAAGEPLPPAPEAPRGHAIEVRLYAEDPAQDFRPATGTIRHLRFPMQARVDTGVCQGDRITPFYDPMLAKLIVHGADREEARHRLQAALAECQLIGFETNLPLLRAIAAHPDFASGAPDTGFIARHAATLLAAPPPPPPAAWAAAALALLAEPASADAADPHSPWAAADAWRLNGAGYQDIWLQAGDAEPVAIRAWPRENAWRLDLPAGPAEARLHSGRLRFAGTSRAVAIYCDSETITVWLDAPHRFRRHDPLAPPAAAAAGADRVVAPIPARVTRVLAKAGDHVARGAPLLVLEAMKMELTLTAPADAVIAAIAATPGEMVEEGTSLVTFAAE